MDTVFISPRIADKVYSFMGTMMGSVGDLVDPNSVVYRDQPHKSDNSNNPYHGHGHFQTNDKGHYIPLDSYGSTEEPTNHCHNKRAAAEVDHKARRKLILASILCLIFMIGEAIGGAMAHSLAVVTDAAHLLTDFASFMISLMAIYMASRPATKRMNFGWFRAEVMGALISVLMIWVVTGILVYLAVLRIVDQDYEIHAEIMVVTAAIGVGFNLVMGLTLHQHSHGHLGTGHGHSHGGHGHSHGGHGHGHGHHDSEEEETDLDDDVDASHHVLIPESHDHSHHSHDQHNINVKAAFIHVLGDFCQSLGVLIAAIIVYMRPEWKIADPICTFLFSVMVLLTTINILKDTMAVLMEGAPVDISFNDVKLEFNAVAGVRQVHNLRTWSLTTNKTALSVHLALENADFQYVLKQATRLARSKFGFYDVTIQLEDYTDDMVGCAECRDPSD